MGPTDYPSLDTLASSKHQISSRPLRDWFLFLQTLLCSDMTWNQTRNRNPYLGCPIPRLRISLELHVRHRIRSGLDAKTSRLEIQKRGTRSLCNESVRKNQINLHTHLQLLHETYGKCFSVNLGPNRRCVVVSDTKILKELFQNSDALTARYVHFSLLTGITSFQVI